MAKDKKKKRVKSSKKKGSKKNDLAIEDLHSQVYNSIAEWHNNDQRLSDKEMGTELRVLSLSLIELMSSALLGSKVNIRSGEKR
jgi:hypothetical protein